MMKTESINTILHLVKKNAKLDLSEYRQEVLIERVKEHFKLSECNDQDGYLHFLKDKKNLQELVDTIGINVSCFFRNPIVFEMLSEIIIPNIFLQLAKTQYRELRVWSAGCSHGEETYSLAITLNEAIKKYNKNVNPIIFGTDIDNTAIACANKGCYSYENVKNSKLSIVDSYFEQKNGHFYIKNKVKKMVSFSIDNLLAADQPAPRESIYGGFNIILCRNLLIYFNSVLQEKVLRRFYKALAPGGYLILGMAETLTGNLTDLYNVIDNRYHIYQKKL